MVTANDFVTCTETGAWTLPIPRCELMSCVGQWENTAAMNTYTRQCNSTMIDSFKNTYPASTICRFTCKREYYRHSGESAIQCLQSGEWNGNPLDCRASECPRIPNLTGVISVHNPAYNCFENILKVGDQCKFYCPNGYSLKGNAVLECLETGLPIGKWSVDTSKTENIPTCIDEEAPKFADEFRCNSGINIKKETLPGKNYAEIDFEFINVTDNSGERPQVTCWNGTAPCHYEMGQKYIFTITNIIDITFKATDSANNAAKCLFRIKIEDKEPPTVVFCPDNILKKTGDNSVLVIWDEPKFSDNCGVYPACDIRISSNIPNGQSFFLGTRNTVAYTARDESNNINENCKFDVKIEAIGCPRVEPPRNGLVIVNNNIAQPKCSKGRYATVGLSSLYICVSGMWMAAGGFGEFPFPDCIAKDPPDGVSQETIASLQYEGDCSEIAVQEHVKTKFMNFIPLAPGVTMDDLDLYCGSTTLVNRRRRSAAREITLKFKLVTKASKELVRQDPRNTFLNLKNILDSKLIPESLTAMEKYTKWRDMNKYLARLDTVNKRGPSVETCTEKGDEQNNKESKFELKCVVCNAGSFKNTTSGKCEPCPVGQYQPKSGQTQCLRCPEGTIIVGGDTKNFTSCKTLCKPGEYSPNGLAPCFKCELGYYSDKPKSLACTKCPDGTTSLTTGTASKFECGSACPPGTYSHNGVEPCSPCPKGFYQPHSGRDMCLSCPILLSTVGKGTVYIESCIDINDCISNPCMNDGHCIDLKDNYRCECQVGYWGKNCELEIDDCQFGPCINNGTCLDKYKSYKCMCEPGTSGDNCDQILRTCQSNSCSGHGNCLDVADQKIKCVCNDFYTGEFCETRVDQCAENPCGNTGECILSQDLKSYSCLCKAGYHGETCNLKVDNCGSNPCQNEAKCEDQSHGYSCMCKPGYEGRQCETRTNMCMYMKCHNDGECESLENDVKCKCAPGFYGKQCDMMASTEFDLSLQSRVSPSFASVHGRKDLHQFTIAFWMRTSDKENIGTPVSYAVINNGILDDNALVLADYSNFNLVINNETQSLEFDANDGEWHHIAVTWNNKNGLCTSYLDGSKLSSAKKPMQQGKYIPKGGVFVIGEEQDNLGSDFTPYESFFGDLSQLNIWDREFTENEIYDLALSCNHETGNVVAWSDFAVQNTGRVIKTTPSRACNFNSNLREYQYLKDRNLPKELLVIPPNFQLKTYEAENCALECHKRLEWCRSFTFVAATQSCQLFSATLLLNGKQPVSQDGADLYLLSCVKSLGMGSGRIPNSQITSNSVMGNAFAYLARLDNTPKSANEITYWQPNDLTEAYLEINFKEQVRITGVATQGHPNKDIPEFASSYKINYRVGNGAWQPYNNGQVLIGNTAAGERTVRQDVNIQASDIRIYPSAGSGSRRVALRVEVYGCPLKPQGTPQKRPQNNLCSNSPCRNGGTCYNLYQRYKCVCPQGFSGNECQIQEYCKPGDIDAPLNGYVQFSPVNQMSFTSATPHCNSGYKLIQQTVNVVECKNGQWKNAISAKCVDINECNSNVCSDGCENLIGSYRCICPVGKYLSNDGKTCLDKDECKMATARCEYDCINTPGGFQCTCPKGYYVPEKRMCHDINECTTGTHSCEQLCENTLSSYKCKCRPGYRLNPDGKTCTFIRCGALNAIARGSVNIAGDTATYSCNVPYQLDGIATRKCLADGTWSGREPKCEKFITCVPILLSPENGEIISQTGNTYKSTVSFRCKPGYTLFGPSTITCGQDSTWSDALPQCAIVVCKRYGVVNGEMLGYGKVVGSVSLVQCNKGYRLRTPQYEFRKCEANGQWTGGDTQMVCDIIDCGNVESIGNVMVNYVSGTKYNSLARYSCAANECLEGNVVRRCQADGKWSGSAPTCQRNSCCAPSVPQHAALYSDGIYTKGHSAFIKCDTGYVTGGDEFRECVFDSVHRWDGKETTCTVVNCGDPGTPLNGLRQVDSFTYQSKISFFCQPAYIMKGSSERICQANGLWSGIQPTCELGKSGGHVKGTSGALQCDVDGACHWLIEVTQGKKVSIQVHTFNLGNGDKFLLYDGQSWEPFIVFTNNSQPLPVTANGHFMRIITNGFVSLSYSEKTCGGLFSEPNGVITSPNYPNHYPPNLDCYWTIHRPYNRIQLRFTYFLIQRRSVDYVTVREGPFTNADILLYNYFNDVIPWLLKDWADRWYWIHFHSDPAYANPGFQALYSNYEPRTV